ncbi:hypothetical protein KCP78_21640 [Salmonella enterica subsp. enterica]|nr:hypothetical protein KCP78_21640 [Salmonella enterica subsp. enterica]
MVRADGNEVPDALTAAGTVQHYGARAMPGLCGWLMMWGEGKHTLTVEATGKAGKPGDAETGLSSSIPAVKTAIALWTARTTG